MKRFLRGICLAGGLVLMLAGAAQQQQRTQRLVLKDGSFQTVTRWEITGDRVRYMSAERFQWEEIPSDLVDWLATEKYNREHLFLGLSGTTPLKPEESLIEPDPEMVAPGLHLPDGGGIFLLDNYQNQPQLVELAQNNGEVNRHMGRNILRAAINPVALSSRQTIELKGEHAPVASHISQPAIYIDVTPASPDSSAPHPTSSQARYGIVHLEQDAKKNLRVVGNLNVAIYGKVSQKENWIKTTSTTVGEWTKVLPDQPLTAGEYAVVELLEKGQINLFVWDFSADPRAPANKNVWTARGPAPGHEGSEPALEKRPK